MSQHNEHIARFHRLGNKYDAHSAFYSVNEQLATIWINIWAYAGFFTMSMGIFLLIY